MATATKKTVKKTPIEHLCAKLIAKLEAGVAPWRKMYSSYGYAKNYFSDHTYSGINFLTLNFMTDHTIPLYVTRKQLWANNGQLKEGATPEWVFYYKSYTPKKNRDGSPNAEETVRKFSKVYPIFNIEQTTLEWERPHEVCFEHEPIPELEDIIEGNFVDWSIKENDNPHYIPEFDHINMPPKETYEDILYWYKSMMHEMMHRTGHESRLNRVGITELDRSDKQKYGREELIAELGASYIFSKLGLNNEDLFENTAAYLNGWIKLIKEDPYAIQYAASKAEAGVNLMMAAKEAWQCKNPTSNRAKAATY